MLAVSTIWNFDRHGSLAGAVREIRQLGYEAVELAAAGPVPDGEEAGRLCREIRAACRSVRAPLGPAGWTAGDPARDLAAPDEGRRSRAVAAVLASLPAAAAAGAETVVLSLGAIEIEGARERWRRWRRSLVETGAPPAEEIAAALAERRARRDRALEAAARSLFDLARAEPDVTFAFLGQGAWHEIPDLAEVELLLSDSAGRRVAYWHDAARAHILERLGIADAPAWLDRYGARTAGLSLSDVAGETELLPPGAGEVDFRAVVPYTGARMVRTLAVHPRHSAAELAMGADHVRSVLGD